MDENEHAGFPIIMSVFYAAECEDRCGTHVSQQPGTHYHEWRRCHRTSLQRRAERKTHILTVKQCDPH